MSTSSSEVEIKVRIFITVFFFTLLLLMCTTYLSQRLFPKNSKLPNGHSICFRTEDGDHCSVSKEQLADWAREIVNNRATYTSPPSTVVLQFADNLSKKRLVETQISDLKPDGIMSSVKVPVPQSIGATFLSALDNSFPRWKNRGLLSRASRWEKQMTQESFPSLAELEKYTDDILGFIEQATNMSR
ncbi:hypothetical protein M422DRAFT_254240 [Sphaerobolus stellatus SS14]|uniref:Unplaced genomic scaffold SPHSTscaffold_54, whole genome shotgun sequence n=1 Tax=Sphaerobolus stellatus (strain SS14) TaxID=990650 RepID=A0A0C9VV74_SPHS4|nr:hypothetical protein M422DRAFT_254240 [Sphaerobolus stellatus SS14]